MKPENPIRYPGTLRLRACPRPTDKRNEKKLQFTLEAGHYGSAVVLHCQGRIIFSSEARALSTIVAEVLPSARRMVVDLAGIDSVDSGGLGELVLTHMWAEAAGILAEVCQPQEIGSAPLRNHQPRLGFRCVRQRSGGDGGDGSGRNTLGVKREGVSSVLAGRGRPALHERNYFSRWKR